MHLWEIDHPYYCNDGNYFNNDCTMKFSSWADFYDEFGNADMDYNLVFRWDWKRPDRDDWLTEEEFLTQPQNVLHVYFMGQRKGLFQVAMVEVEESDEAAVYNYLQSNAEHLRRIWNPLLNKES